MTIRQEDLDALAAEFAWIETSDDPVAVWCRAVRAAMESARIAPSPPQGPLDIVGDVEWSVHCHYCGRLTSSFGAADTRLTIDHVIPRAQGGPNIAANLVDCCRRCNQDKGNRTPAQWTGRWYDQATTGWPAFDGFLREVVTLAMKAYLAHVSIGGEDLTNELIRAMFDRLSTSPEIDDPDSYEGWLIPAHLCNRLREAFQ